jgi:hypothetical protein
MGRIWDDIHCSLSHCAIYIIKDIDPRGGIDIE